MKQFFINICHYMIHHNWTADILRANFVYITLIILFSIFHFGLQPVGWSIFFRLWLLLNLCQLFKALLDYVS